MKLYLALIAGFIIGEWVIGGILYAIFGRGLSPDTLDQKHYTWIGRFIGMILAGLIVSSN